MKVILVTESYPPKAGGSGWSCHQLAKSLRDAGHGVHVVYLGRHNAEYKFQDVPVIEIEGSAVKVPGLRLVFQELVDAVRLANLLSKMPSLAGGDIVHAQHRITTLAVAKLPPEARGKISTVRDYWPICDTGQLFADMQPCAGCNGLHIGRCLGQRYPLFRNMLPLFPIIGYFRRSRCSALMRMDAIIAVSRFVAHKVRKCVQARRMYTVPNMVEVGPVMPSRSKARRAIFVGKLEHSKGAHLLPELLRALPKGSELVVAGTGNLREYLVNYGLAAMRCLGWIDHEELRELMSTSSVLVFPSLWPEPLSRVLLEASAFGLPVVAFPVGGNPEIVKHGVNGYLVRSVDEMAEKTAEILVDSTLRSQLSEGGMHIVREKFSPSKVLPQILSVYNYALQRISG